MKPLLQTQSVNSSFAFCSVHVWLGQLVHAEGPTLALYFPIPHAVQLPPLGPVNPLLHKQSTRALLAV